MAKNADDLIAALPEARQRRIRERARTLIREEMSLRQLRRARALTQVDVAQGMGVAQKQISKMEQRSDMHLSTLRRSVEAMGGKLSLVVEFPDREPVILTGL